MPASLPWALGITLAVLGFVLTAWALFWDRARGRLRCPSCWYDLAALTNSPRCPECGREIRHAGQLGRTRRRWRWAAVGIVLLAGGIAWPLARMSEQDWISLSPTRVLVELHFSDRWRDSQTITGELSYTRIAQGRFSARQQRWLTNRCFEVLESSPNSTDRRNAVSLLAWIGGRDPRITPRLLVWLDDPDPAVRAQIVRSFGIYDADPRAVVPVLVGLLVDAGEDPRVRSEAAGELGAYGPAAAHISGSVLAMLDDPDPRVSDAAADAIGSLDPDPTLAVPMLTQMIRQPRRPNSVLAAVRSLGNIGAPAAPALPELMVLLANPYGDPDPAARMHALRAIGQIGAAAGAARPALLALVNDPNEHNFITMQARAAIEVIDGRQPGYAEALAAVLSDPLANRVGALSELRRLGPLAAPAVPALAATLHDPARMVAASAALALTTTGPAADAAIPELRKAKAHGMPGYAGYVLETIARRESPPPP